MSIAIQLEFILRYFFARKNTQNERRKETIIPNPLALSVFLAFSKKMYRSVTT